MSKGMRATYQSLRLKLASNPILRQLQKQEWIFTVATPHGDRLYDDIVSDDLWVTDQDRFSMSYEYRDLQNRLSKRSPVLQQAALKSYIRRMHKSADLTPDFEAQFALLEKHWKSALSILSQHAIQAALENHPHRKYQVNATPKAVLHYVDGRFFVDVTLSGICLVEAGLNLEKPLSGEVISRFGLTENGFKLETLNASTPLLQNLCFSQRVNITPKELNREAKEYEYEEAVESLKHMLSLCREDDPRISPANAVIEAVMCAKSKHFSRIELYDLQDIVRSTEALLLDTIDSSDLNRYTNKASVIAKKHPWGQRVAEAMLCLAGAALVAIGCAMTAITSGAALPWAIPAIAVGGSMMGAGGYLLFKSFQKNPVVENMEKMAAAAKMTLRG